MEETCEVGKYGGEDHARRAIRGGGSETNVVIGKGYVGPNRVTQGLGCRFEVLLLWSIARFLHTNIRG